jgi:MFS family permease
MFSGLSFIKTTMHVEDITAEVLVGIAAALGMGFYIYFGHLSDRIGRKKPIVIGYLLTLLLLFPAYWFLGSTVPTRNAGEIVIAGADCSYDAFAPKQSTKCGRLMGDFTGAGLGYTLKQAPDLRLSIGGKPIALADLDWDDAKARKAKIDELSGGKLFSAEKVKPTLTQSLLIVAALLVLMALSGATYGPVAALLAEMFPARVRYSSMSIPYHIGTGYFGGFLPFIATLIVAKTGNPTSGLWYTWVVVLIALLVAWWGLPSGKPRDFGDDAA